MSQLDFLLDILNALVFLVNLWILFSLVYYCIVSFWGYKSPRTYSQQEPSCRFLVFIPACNEEKVIADAIRSIRATNYPRELVDICVIADNCKDRTRERAESCGERVCETCSLPGEPVGKPHAIKKVLDQHPEYYADYDMMVIIDADNVVTENFFREINSQYLSEGKPAAIQAYPGCKNNQGWVAFFYYHMYVVNNRFSQLAKYNLGINNALAGTGMAISMQALLDIGGWNANSLTEDLEIQIKFTLKGKRILWNHAARIYDEKPTRASVALRQRTRWSQGHWYVALHNIRPLTAALFHRTISIKEWVSSMCFMFSMPMSIQLPLMVVVMVVTLLMEQFHLLRFLGFTNVSLLRTGILTIPFLYMLFVLFFVAEWKDLRRPFSFSSAVKVLVSYLIGYPLTLLSQVMGLFQYRNQQTWVKTDHRINGIQKDDALPKPVRVSVQNRQKKHSA